MSPLACFSYLFFINLAREGAGEDVQKENAGEGPNFKMPCSHRSAGETKE